ncbi:FctA domain-containing protein [Enterococcus casseliflavus]|uniref:Spy0128 family protein n=1 Tax=Enterococcus casseliflavus TaxID=37734 RepID=UPI00232AFFA4|nr:FctA domain-containing protein [Enterococcus casseliflavus]MDB1696460.1 FctA domain-containing protein [Enterococcus casseliflavus]MDB1699444.1 FctA domain-containing protein [Enterococcus casseliflavus]MDB1701670.1 FctA domain-containing protein [Enterococcus casseliflavus]MDB1706627.1 FctA domain-containing protein [Enterococcus casseliflavus]
MKKQFSIYICLLVLLGSILCEPTIILAEAINATESTESTTETLESTEPVTGTIDTEKAPTDSSTAGAVQSATSQAEEEQATVPSESQATQASSTLNQNSIQPRAPDAETETEASATAENLSANLNERGVQLFDNVRITDLNDQPFTAENPPMYNDNIKIHFDWSLADTEEIRAGDYYTYQLPNYFAIHNTVSGELTRSGGQSIGSFTLALDGTLTVTFNEAAQTLSNRSGTIDLITELSVSTVTEEVTIPTGIYDEDGHEIIITLPIYEVDIIKTGNVTSSGSVVWEIIFNQASRELHDVVITDKMPQGLAYSTSTGYLYDESTDEWIRTDGLYTFNSVNNTFTFNQTVNQPVRIVINSAVTDPTASSFKNTATINGSDFTEKTAEATVTYDEQSEYKRFKGYDPETKRASWEISVTLDKDQARVLDQTYSGTDPEKALHFFVPETLVITDKDGNPIPSEDWSFDGTEQQNKEGEIVRFGITFAKAGYYKIQYDTQLYESVLADTRIYNYASIRDNQNTSLTGSGTVTPTKTIGVVKTAGTKDYETKTVAWKIDANTNQQTVSDLIIEDRYQLISGANSSALALLADTLVVTASGVTEPLVLDTDYTLELIKETKTLTDGTTKELETGFRIKLQGAYQTTSTTITVNFKTSFDIVQQGTLPGSSTGRFSNAAFVHYKDEAGNTFTEASETNTWMDTNWLKNALKYGLFIGEGEDVAKAITAVFGRNLGTIFDEQTASSDQVYWMGLFNTYKEKINKDATITDQLQEGQTLKDLALYTVTVTGYTTQVRALKEQLVENEDYIYTYDPDTKKVTITLLKETSETLAVFLATEAAEEVFTYKNTITLTDNDTTLTADGQVDKSAKTDWLMKNGSQNAENNRLLDWEIMINADSRKIHNAVVTDTINYNQHTFLRDADDNVIVDVYEAVLNNGTWEKGEKVTFINEDNPKITSDVVAGTQSLVIAFEEMIDKPYFIVYQTQLDPGILNNERVANSVNLTGSEIEIHTVTKEVTIKSTDGSGTSSGTNGSLTIVKYDADGTKERGIDEEAVFQLSRKNAQNTYEVILSNLVVKNNQIMENGNAIDRIDNLRYGDYMIQEITAPEGYERDATQYTFTISDEQVNYVFELANKREIKETTLAFNVQKLLDGRELKDGEFTFYLVDEAGSVILTQTNDGNGQVTFDAITYNEPGEYHYTIREKAGNDPTITYTDKELKVTVTVTEEDSQLIAKAVYEGNQVFENDYTPKAGSVVLNAEKVLIGRDLKAEEFDFELVNEAGTVLQTKANDATGKIYFDAIPYDKAGEYRYTIREKAGTDGTITYDAKELAVVVTVTDEDGQLTAVAEYEGNQVFENSYQPKAGSVVLSAEKVLTGRTLQANEFDFELVDEAGNVLQTKANDATGKIYFDALPYEETGEYHYTIREKAGTDGTITYDAKELAVVVTVTDEDGQLTAVTEYEGNQVFENDYTPKAGGVVLNVEKVLTGRSLEANEFAFELVDEAGDVVQTKSNDAIGQIYFDELTYDEIGEYRYTIREKAGADSTVTYDTKEIGVVVRVTDEDGQLVATATYEGNQVFENDYTPQAGSVVLSAEKVLIGRTLQADEFAFELVDEEGNILQTKANDGTGKIYFDALAYDKAGEYHYTIREQAGSNSTITYDAKELAVVVTVTDEAGQLTAVAEYEGNQVFENSYQPKAGSVVLIAEKVLTGRTLQANEFDFELVNEDGSVLQTKANDGTGKIYFDALPYEETGEYHYTIREKAGIDGTITYDRKELAVVVTVTDEDGQLTAVAEYEGNQVFENSYQPQAGSVVLSAEKVLTGRTLQANEFDFELVNEDGTVLQTKANDATGKIYFDALSYEETGEYHYTIREKAGTDGTITYDAKELAVVVTVTDEDGQLTAVAEYEDNQVFENSYQPQAGSVVLSAKKVLTGRDLQANEFAFELVDEAGKVLQTQRNDANGTITFDALTYDDAGEHRYTIREKAGNDATIIYDETTYQVTVTVKDQAGKLVAEAEQTADMVFNNRVKEGKTTKPGTGNLPKTNDTTTAGWVVLGLLLVVIAVGIYLDRKKRTPLS